MSKVDYTKEELLRALITNISETREYPDKVFPAQFYGKKYGKLFAKLAERKKDLPSLEFLVSTYEFEPHKTSLTQKDIIEKLDVLFIEERLRSMLGTYKDARGEGLTAAEIAVQLEKELKHAVSATEGASTIELSSEPDRALDSYIALQESGPPLKTGFRKMDLIAPVRRGNLVLIIGGTKGGKSITLNKMFCTNIENGVGTSMWSLELPVYQVVNRMLAGLQKFPYNKLAAGRVDREEYQQALSQIQSPVFISTRQNVSGRINADALERHVDTIMNKGIDLQTMYLDYHTLFDTNTAWDAQESFTGRLKQIALRYNIAVFLAAQADTATVQADEMPGMYSTQKNKTIATDADQVIGLLGKPIPPGDRYKLKFEVLARRDGGLPEFSYLVNLNEGIWEEEGEDDLLNV